MVTICLECGERIDSILDFVEGIKTLRHLNEHPQLKKQFHANQESVTDAVSMEDGVLHLVGDLVSYKNEDGSRTIEVYRDGNKMMEFNEKRKNIEEELTH